MDGGPGPRIEGVAAEYDLGATITGRIIAEAADDVAVALVFETSGLCDPEEAVLRQVDLGPCSGSVPFRIEGPNWPPTYVGTSFAGHWYLEATATTDGRRDVDRHLVTMCSATNALEVRPARPPSAAGSGVSGRVRRLVALALLEVASIAAAVVGLAAGSALWVVGLIVALALLVPLIGTAQGVMSFRAAGGFSAQVDQQGDVVVVEASVEQLDRVESVTATLSITEATQRNVGYDHPESRHHVVHQVVVPLDPDGSGGFRGSVPLTAQDPLPYTMSHSRAQVVWSVEVRVVLSGAPDIVDAVALVVRPAGAPISAR